MSTKLMLNARVWLHFVVSRVIYLVAAMFTEIIMLSGNLNKSPIQGSLPWPSVADWPFLLFRALFYGDSGWYWGIAANGYERAPFAYKLANWAFFPLYPELVALFGLNQWVGIIISNLCTLLAVLVLHNLLMKRYSSLLADRVVILMLYFPFSYDLSVFRPEGLLLLLIVLTYVFSLQHNWGLAGLCGFLAALTKAEGLSATILIAYAYLASINFQWRRIRFGSIATLGPFVGIALFSLYLWNITGNPFAWMDVRLAWAQTIRFPWTAVTAYPSQPLFIDYGGWNLAGVNWLVMIVSLVTAGYLFARSIRGRNHEELGLGVFSLLFILAIMTTAGTINFGRYALAIFPLFIVWGRLLKRDILFEAVIVGFAGLLALFGAWMGLGLNAVMV